MTIVEEGAVLERAQRRRPWWFTAALIGTVVGAVFGTAIPSPPKSDLLPIEQEVIDRLRSARVSAAPIRERHYDAVLGSAFLAREFDLAEYGTVYMIFPTFVSGQGEVRVCPAPTDDPNNLGRVVFVDGQITSSVNPPPWVYLVSARYFIIAPDARAVDVLELGLDAKPAPC